MSKKIYLVKKEPLGPHTENNWKQLTGREFHEFITSPEGKGRYFIKMEDDFNEGSDIIFIEASKEQYFEWRKEHDQHKYLNYHAKDVEVVSTDLLITAEETMISAIPDESDKPEEYVLRKERLSLLKEVLQKLNSDDLELIMTTIPGHVPTLQMLSEKQSISYDALRKRRSRLKKKILHKIKN